MKEFCERNIPQRDIAELKEMPQMAPLLTIKSPSSRLKIERDEGRFKE